MPDVEEVANRSKKLLSEAMWQTRFFSRDLIEIQTWLMHVVAFEETIGSQAPLIGLRKNCLRFFVEI